MTTGQRIKEARKKAGMTQKALGEALGISYQTVAQWENDLRNPKQETLLKIAKALGVHLRDLADTSMWEEFDRQAGPEKLATLSAESSALDAERELSETDRRIIELFLKLDDPARSALLGYANRLVEERCNKPPEQDIPIDIDSQLERYRHGLLMGIATAQADYSLPPEDFDVNSITLTPELSAMVEDAVKKQRKILEAEQQKK